MKTHCPCSIFEDLYMLFSRFGDGDRSLLRAMLLETNGDVLWFGVDFKWQERFRRSRCLMRQVDAGKTIAEHLQAMLNLHHTYILTCIAYTALFFHGCEANSYDEKSSRKPCEASDYSASDSPRWSSPSPSLNAFYINVDIDLKILRYTFVISVS